jgi:hypothetical protein
MFRVAIIDSDNRYALADFGEAILTTDLESGETTQVDLKEFSPFEQQVYESLLYLNKE